MKIIRPIPLLSPFTMPTVYDDSLSYEEHLARVIAKLNEVIENYNGVIDETKAYTDKAIATLNKSLTKTINELRVYLDDATSTLEKSIKSVDDASKQRYERLLSTLNANVRQLRIEIKATETMLEKLAYQYFIQGKTYTLARFTEERIHREMDIAVINTRLDTLVDEFPLVYNMFKAKEDTLQHTLNNIYSGLRTLCMTVKSFDSIGKTVEEIDNLDLNAYQWDVYSGYIFRGNKLNMYDPYTGEFIDPRKVIIKNFNKLAYNGKSAEEFDALNIIAEDFDASDFDARMQDIDREYTSQVLDNINKYYNPVVTLYEGDSDIVANVTIPDDVDTIRIYYDKPFLSGSSTVISHYSRGILEITNITTGTISERLEEYQMDGTNLYMYTRYITIDDKQLSCDRAQRATFNGETISFDALRIRRIEGIKPIKHFL